MLARACGGGAFVASDPGRDRAAYWQANSSGPSLSFARGKLGLRIEYVPLGRDGSNESM